MNEDNEQYAFEQKPVDRIMTTLFLNFHLACYELALSEFLSKSSNAVKIYSMLPYIKDILS